jgi:predicted amidohydrolase
LSPSGCDLFSAVCIVMLGHSGAYQNGTWVAAVAKVGREEGRELLGQSCIIVQTGEDHRHEFALADELIVADWDLDRTREIKGISSISPCIASSRNIA